MVKNSPRVGRNKKQAPQRRGASSQGARRQGRPLRQTAYIQPRLDKPAVDWLRLLSDPCGANLTSPCYGGSGTGYFTRQQQIIAPPATAVDYVLEFSPSITGPEVFRIGYSNTAGGTLGTVTAIPLYGLMTSSAVQRYRCIAACIKVQYTGTELNRAGLVSSILLPGVELALGETIATTSTGFACSMNHTNRMGEQYEFRWAPGEGDQEFVANTYGDTHPNNAYLGNSLQVLLRGIAPGTAELHVTTCWEWVPSQEGSPWAPAPAKSPPSVPFQTVMSAIGDLGKWTARNLASGAANLISSAATAALRAPTPALFLM